MKANLVDRIQAGPGANSETGAQEKPSADGDTISTSSRVTLSQETGLPGSSSTPQRTPFEPERYELVARPRYHFDFDRRAFFKVLGGGVAVFLVLKDGSAALQESGRGRRRSFEEHLPQEIGAWLHIGEDSVVTVYTGKAEMGQNIRTSLAQAVAEELQVPLDAIRMTMGDTDLTPFDMGTFGSRTTPTMAPQLR